MNLENLAIYLAKSKLYLKFTFQGTGWALGTEAENPLLNPSQILLVLCLSARVASCTFHCAMGNMAAVVVNSVVILKLIFRGRPSSVNS